MPYFRARKAPMVLVGKCAHKALRRAMQTSGEHIT